MSRLTHVLRAGEARRQSVRTGTLTMKDMNDDELRLILDAVARGASNEACAAAKKWCALNKRHHHMCQEAGDGVWQTLTTRIFGATAPTVYAGPGNAQENFYALCRRDRAQKYIQSTLTAISGTDEHFLALLGDVLAHIDAGGKETPNGRLHLVALVTRLFGAFPDKFVGYQAAFSACRVCDAPFLYTMLKDRATEEEKEAALDLLGAYASNYELDIDFDYNQHEDRRYGYELAGVRHLKDLFRHGNLDRKLKVLKIWTELMLVLEGSFGADADMVRYAREMVKHSVQTTLSFTIATGVRSVTSEKEYNLRNNCAFALEYITHALYLAQTEPDLQNV